MANVHYARIGDIWKHLPLAEILAIEHPESYWESHAGSSSYPLTRSPERDYGVFPFLERAVRSKALEGSAYRRLLSLRDRGETPTTYPGSPLIAMGLLGSTRGRFVFCDLDGASLANIAEDARALGIASDRAQLVQRDGVSTLEEELARLMDEEASGTFLHVDSYRPLEPGHGGETPLGLFAHAAERGVRCMLWYGFDARGARAIVLDALREGIAGGAWYGEVSLRAEDLSEVGFDPGVVGCGVVVCNVGQEALAACSRVGEGLAHAYAGARLPNGRDGGCGGQARRPQRLPQGHHRLRSTIGYSAPLGLLLPLAELTVAATLLPASTAWWGALGALAVLSVFVVGITYNLARGRKPDCHCFGQLHSAPAGWKTLARNGVLAAIAGFVLCAGYEGGAGPSTVAWVGALSTAQQLALLVGVLVLALLAGQGWFLIHLLRQNGRLLVRLEAVEATLAEGGSVLATSQNGTPVRQEAEGLPVGSEAPEFSLSGLYGETFTLEALRAPGKPVMMLFTDPGCGPCNAMLPEVGRWQEEQAQKLTLALLSRGEMEENKTKAQEHALKNVVLQKDWEVSESYEIRGTPSAVLVSADGKVASPVAGGDEGIRGLFSYAVGERAQLPMQPHQPQTQGQPCPNCGKVHAAAPTVPAAQKVGEAAPEVKLPDLEGNTVALADFRGQQTLVLFWNPGCGFCQQMLPDLKEWEMQAPKDAPRLVVVSAGSEEANKEMGLTSPVLLDQQFAVGRAFGASGTPSAVLIEAEGKVASEVAVGAPGSLSWQGRAEPDRRL